MTPTKGNTMFKIILFIVAALSVVAAVYYGNLAFSELNDLGNAIKPCVDLNRCA